MFKYVPVVLMFFVSSAYAYSDTAQRWESAKTIYEREPVHLWIMLNKFPDSSEAPNARMMLSKSSMKRPAVVTNPSQACFERLEYVEKHFNSSMKRRRSNLKKTYGIKYPKIKIRQLAEQVTISESAEYFPRGKSGNNLPIEKIFFIDVGLNSDNECYLKERTGSYGLGLSDCNCTDKDEN